MFGLSRAIKRSLRSRILAYVLAISVVVGVASTFLFHRAVVIWNRRLYSRANREVAEEFPKLAMTLDHKRWNFFKGLRDRFLDDTIFGKKLLEEAVEEFYRWIEGYLKLPTEVRRLVVLDDEGRFLRAFRRVRFPKERRFGIWLMPEVRAFSEPDQVELSWMRKVHELRWEGDSYMAFLEHRPCPEGYERVVVYRFICFPSWKVPRPYDTLYVVVAERLDKVVEEALRGRLRSAQGVLLVDPSGTVLYHRNPAWLHQNVRKFLPRFPLGDHIPEGDFYLGLRDGGRYLMRLARWEGGTVLGVYTDYRMEEIAFLRKTLGMHIAIFLAVFGVGLVALGLGLSRTLRTVSKLTEEVRAVAEGKLEGAVPVEGEDEVAVLAGEFNRMAGRLRETLERLARERAERQRHEEVARFKGRLMAQVAHDLRRVLGVIRTPAQRLEVEEVDERRRRTLRRILAGTRLIEGMAEDMEMTAQVEEGKVEVRAEGFTLGEFWRDVEPFVSAVAERASPYGVSVRMEPVQDDVPISGDREKLTRVLVNLVSNGVQAVRSGGRGGEVVVRAWEEGDTVKIEVRDEGPGVPEEELPRIFDPFFKGRYGSGIGLGLSIVKGFVEAHGGKIEVESKPGGGSTFRIVLPKRGPDAQGARG